MNNTGTLAVVALSPLLTILRKFAILFAVLISKHFKERFFTETSMANFDQLGARERQIVEAVYRLEEGSVSEVLETLADPPSYSAVRAMLNILTDKGYLDYRLVKNKYLYRPAGKKKAAQKTVLRNVVDNFFGSQTTEAVAALLDGTKLDEAEYRRLRELIDGAKRVKK